MLGSYKEWAIKQGPEWGNLSATGFAQFLEVLTVVANFASFLVNVGVP